MAIAREVDIVPVNRTWHSFASTLTALERLDEIPGKNYVSRISPMFSVGIPHFERHREPDGDEEQRRLGLCLPENEILLLHDRSQDGRALRLRN